jgi:hypothetical protein
MAIMRSFLSIVLLMFLLNLPNVCAAQEIQTVSMLQLIATPEKYDKKEVMVVGFLVTEHEGNILYLHREDYEQRISKNGLWVVLTPENKEKLGGLSKHYVLLAGTFNASNKGHMSLTSGALEDVKRATSWPPETIHSRN